MVMLLSINSLRQTLKIEYERLSFSKTSPYSFIILFIIDNTTVVTLKDVFNACIYSTGEGLYMDIDPVSFGFSLLFTFTIP